MLLKYIFVNREIINFETGSNYLTSSKGQREHECQNGQLKTSLVKSSSAALWVFFIV